MRVKFSIENEITKDPNAPVPIQKGPVLPRSELKPPVSETDYENLRLTPSWYKYVPLTIAGKSIQRKVTVKIMNLHQKYRKSWHTPISEECANLPDGSSNNVGVATESGSTGLWWDDADTVARSWIVIKARFLQWRRVISPNSPKDKKPCKA